TVMLHGIAYGGFDRAWSVRGREDWMGAGWVMAMARRPLAGGELALRAMLSPEPLTVPARGYPLLLQSGEAYGGEPLHDRQHPHDLFMETAAMWTRELGPDLAFQLYAAPAGEPALGPGAFPHRPPA